jgi:hypothetical protein
MYCPSAGISKIETFLQSYSLFTIATKARFYAIHPYYYIVPLINLQADSAALPV